jgi:hypothetical protein
MTLAELQRDFRSWLVDASDDAAASLDPRSGAGLSVYQNNYRAQLVSCLESAFPLLRMQLGDEAFLHVAATHIEAYPPHAWTLDDYPDDFGDTLASIFPDNPDLHELAWLEHALAAAFVAPDAKSLSVDALATVDWDKARLRLAPSLRSRTATTNADEVWSALNAGTPPPESEMLAEAGGLIVWRRAYMSYLLRVDALERDALLHLQHDGRFASLCEMLVERLGEVDGVTKAGMLLSGWFERELIAGIDMD